MGDFNKVISFVLGLIVVVVFLAVVTGRLNIRQRFLGDKKVVAPTVTPTPKPANKKGFFSFLKKATPTPSPIVKVTYPTPTNKPVVMNDYKNNRPIATPTNEPASSIPATGAETALLPFALSSLVAGFMLRRVKK